MHQRRRNFLVALVLLVAAYQVTAQLSVVGSNIACTKRSDCGMLPSLGCVEGQCRACIDDKDCEEAPTDNLHRCVVRDGVAQCMNKDVFAPFTGSDVLAAFLAAFSTAMGAACGLGGGGLLVPLYIVVVGLNPKYAIPLSKATILGGAVATYWSNFHTKHPYAQRRPLIDYALAGMMEPATLIGTIFGVMANTMFPSWLILALLMMLLAFVTYRVILKANKMYAHENQEALLENAVDIDVVEASHLQEGSSVESKSADTGARILHTDEDQETRQELFQEESNVFPFRSCILPLMFCIAVILAQSLLRGGHGSPSLAHVKCGSVTYWLLIIPPVGLLAFVTYIMGKKLLKRAQSYAQHGIDTVQGDVEWTPKKAYVIFPFQCFIAGLASALLGIGGGIVQGPVMLEHGVTPLVQSATASYMILFTSTSTTIQYTIAGQFPGQLQYDYVCWYVGLGFVGGIFGKTIVELLIRKTGRMSYFLYFLAINSACQAIAMGYIGIRNVVHDLEIGASMGFTSLCHP